MDLIPGIHPYLNGYVVHTFLGSGTFQMLSAGFTVSYLIVECASGSGATRIILVRYNYYK